VQVDEPLLAGALGARVAPELVHDALRDLAALPHVPALHVCGDIRAIAGELLLLPFTVLDIENTRIANLGALDPDQLAFSDVKLSVGCIDTLSEVAESLEEVHARIVAALERLPAQRLWLSPDCGLRKLAPAAARAKLTLLARAASDVRATL